MKNSYLITLVIVGLAVFLVSTVGFADQKGAADKHPTPQMAGFAMLPADHSCTTDYAQCLGRCKGDARAYCQTECLSDCSVCALDFGEETRDVCRR